jgi:predicted Zn-dependent protease
MRVMHLTKKEAVGIFMLLIADLDQDMPLKRQIFRNEVRREFFHEIQRTFGLNWRDDKKQFVQPI